MNKANECTCPSGDGSLVHPCPAHPAVEQAGANVGHGHVFPRADGVKMRCGGPGLCSECAADAYRARAALAHRAPEVCSECSDTGKVYDESGDGPWSCYACTGNPEVIGYANGDELDNMLDDRTAVLSPGKTSFHTVPVYRLIRAALAQPSPMRCLACGGYHGNSGLPCPNMRVTAQAQPSPAQAEQHWPKLEKPAQVGAIRFSAGVSSRLVVEAAQRLYEFESTPEQEAERIERLQAFREQLDPLNLAPHAEAFNEAPAEALRPEQAEAERPEVAEVAFVLRNIGAMDAEDIDGDNVDLRFEDAEGRDTGCDVSIVEYAEKAADLLEQQDRIVGELRADRDSWAEQAEQRLADWDEMRKERDAALAEVERLRESKGDPVGSLEKCMKVMYERDEHAKRLEAALARVAELEKELAMARDAAAKGDAARQQCGGMEMEIEELRAELAELRARVAVVPDRLPRSSDIAAIHQHSIGWNACLDELARLNGMTVSEGLVQGMAKFAREIICGALDGGSFDGADIQESAERHGLIAKQVMNEPCRGPEEYCACAWSTSFPAECYRVTPKLRALLNEDKENSNG
ncbi:TPA: hypothetical protein ACMFQF_002128 [Pseudomonas aeruginosa]